VGEDAKHRRVGVRDPSSKDETADEDNDAGKETFEKIENSDRPDAHKVEDGPLDAQIRKGLVQALEDSIASPEIGFVHESPLCSNCGIGDRILPRQLDAPEPCQHVRGEHGDPSAGGHAS
jgi:hypothetical protein